jgi:hypothetical protein
VVVPLLFHISIVVQLITKRKSPAVNVICGDASDCGNDPLAWCVVKRFARADEYGIISFESEFGQFVRIDANRSIHEVFKSLQAEIKEVLKGMKPPKKLKKERKGEGKPKEKEQKKGA